jgi:signal transduction histidine kinase
MRIVSHDLRNPLSVIAMNTALALQQEGLEEDSQRSLEAVARAAKQMGRLVDDLVDVTRIENGCFTVDKTECTLSPLLAEVAASARAIAGLRIVTVESSGELPSLPIDRDRILQVFSNLVGNAVKFTRPTGRISIQVEVHSREVVLTVCDDGDGIAKEHQRHVFERFWQARPADRRGMGLGLSITKSIVEAHGGRIWVESELGRGTCVSFTLPYTAERS